MIFLDATVVGVALPTMQTDLAMTTSEAAWVVNGFLIAFASTLAIGGRLADRLGRLGVFRTAMSLFALGSLGCALAPNGSWLIATRALQGIAAGTMQPASTAVVIGATPEGRRGRAMATYFGVALLFLMAGPLIGGVLVQFADWPWIFLLNVPVAIIALAMTLDLGLPPSARSKRAFDITGAILLVLGLPSLVLGLEWLGHPPAAASWAPAAIATIGLMLTVGCVAHASRTASPLLQVRLLAPRIMLGQAVVLAIVSLVMSAQAVYGAIYLQEVLAFTPLQAGLGSMPLLVPVVLVIHSAGKTYDRIGSARPVFWGLLITLVGLCIEVIGIIMQTYPILAAGMVFVGAGSTFASTPANTDVLSLAPPDQRGEVSGLVQTMRQLGSAIGIVVCVLAIGWTVRSSMPSQLPDGPTGDSARLALEGNVESLRSLEASDVALAATLTDARASGMAAAFVVQALACCIGLLLAVTLLRPWTPQPAIPGTDSEPPGNRQ